MRRALTVFAGALLVTGVLFAAGAPEAGAATTITVTSNADTGGACTTFPTDCTMRQAFVAASSGGAAQGSDVEIVIQPAVTTVTLANTLNYDGGTGGAHALTLRGAPSTVEGDGTFGLVHSTTSGLLTIDAMTFTKGESVVGIYGGAINAVGPVTVTNSTFTNNGAVTIYNAGGAIYAGGLLTVTNSVFAHNGAGSGGAIAGNGQVVVTNSTFTENSGDGYKTGGGAVSGSEVIVTNSTFADNRGGLGAAVGGGTVTVKGSTFDHNIGDLGGAVFATRVTAVNSTFTDNTAVQGGAISTWYTGGQVTTVYSTFTNNVASAENLGGSAIMLGDGGTIALFGSILVKLPGATSMCAGSSSSAGFNFANESANSCQLFGPGDSSDDSNTADLSALANNGGPTQTRRPQSGSPLIDAIPGGSCGAGNALAGFAVLTDQRGYARPAPTGGACDIGAVEVQPGEPLEPAPPHVTPKFTG